MSYPEKGTILDGKYIVGDLVASGGMAAIVAGIHVLRRAPVALKFLHPKMRTVEGALERFLREAVAASAVQTEHVVRVYDVGMLPDGMPYLVMELLEGRDLATVVKADGKPGLEVPRAVHFTLGVLRALQAAHAIGVVHRDLKPANCFVINHEGDRDFVKVLDFGVSKVKSDFETMLTRADSTVGTPVYMSPEQALSPKDVDARSDIYSLAVMLYRMLSGSLPYKLEDTKHRSAFITALMTVEPDRLERRVPDLPKGLADVVHKGLARDPKDRFQNATEMAEALAPFANSHSQRILEAVRDFDPGATSSNLYSSVEAVLQSLGVRHGEGLTPVSGARLQRARTSKPVDPDLPPTAVTAGGEATALLAPNSDGDKTKAGVYGETTRLLVPETPAAPPTPAKAPSTAMRSWPLHVAVLLVTVFALSYVLVRFVINAE